jgi:hypothetical protein
VALALIIGIAIGWLDSRPGWDDTGVTAGLLVLGAALVAAIDGRRPWLWAILVGAPLPILEASAAPGGVAPLALVALLFATIGATFGIVVRRATAASAGTT